MSLPGDQFRKLGKGVGDPSSLTTVGIRNTRNSGRKLPLVQSPISQLNYEYYADVENLRQNLPVNALQCVIGKGFTAFGKSQQPSLADYADGVDTLQFLSTL